MDEAFAELSGYRRIVDDVVIYENDPTVHTDHVRQFLQQCTEQKITLNPEKWEFTKRQVNFVTFTLSAQGYSIDDSITETITYFPTPANRKDLRVFLALQINCQQARQTSLTSVHDTAFSAAKQALSTAPTLSYFDLNKPTCLCTDASPQGFGYPSQS